MKREFRYERGSHPDQNNCWLMQEFEMDVNDSLVLCTLRKKPSPAVVVAVQESNTTRKRNDPCGNDDSNHLKSGFRWFWMRIPSAMPCWMSVLEMRRMTVE
uniref:uncharacterized protein LOC101298970 isoform X5 n=1 Tax=Fragaria vesca subsp. vesca TaxID=101020 RepID=UPI0005C9247C|nr:PREDICTED: uncharacterized protein LOC101298970 isoform X5 [Fragaria vesca subsp. vesca]